MPFNVFRAASASIAVLLITVLGTMAAPITTTVPTAVMSDLVKRAPTASIIHSCTQPGQVALTYDDGPSNYTQELVDYLNSKNATATFYVNGHNGDRRIETYAPVILHAYQTGHQIASHTYSHQDLNTLSNSAIAREMSRLDEQIKAIIGLRPLFMRPPYGNANEHVVQYLTGLGYYVTNWDIDSQDWAHRTDVNAAFEEFTKILSLPSANSKGYIALHHDTYPWTVQELTPRVVEYLQGAGYQLVTVGHCLGLDHTQWYRD